METSIIIETIVKVVLVLAVFSALAGFTTYIERKILAFMQRRLGPMNVGPYGLLQIAADGIKLFTKEDFIPANANKANLYGSSTYNCSNCIYSHECCSIFP